MKTAEWQGKDNIKIVEKSIPRVGPKDVLIKIKYTGICSSDLHVMDGWLISPPAILGHEFSGIVEDVGDEVTKCKKGDQVVAHPYISCGECDFCQSGKQNLCCSPKRVLSRGNGSFAEYILVNSYNTFVLPENMDLLSAALVEPLSIAVHTFELSKFKPGDLVVILGGGPMGLLFLKMAQHLGAGLTILSEPSLRQKTAREMGADIVTDPENLDKIVKEKSNEMGADICIEAVGLNTTVEQALKIVKPGGQILITGWAPSDLIATFNPSKIYRSQIGIQGVFWSNYPSFLTAIKMLHVWGNKLTVSMVEVFDGLEKIADVVGLIRKKKIDKAIIRVN